MAFSMEGQSQPVDSSLYARYWAPGWNSVQALNKFQSEIGGSLLGGDPGQLLISSSQGCTEPADRKPPQAFAPRAGQLLILARVELFGSEELSSRSETIASLASSPTVHVHPLDAEALGLSADEIDLVFEQATWRLRLQLNHDLPRGVAAATIGFMDQPAIELPAWAKVSSP
jgi:NADH-quinone oxidoreductase subunit G